MMNRRALRKQGSFFGSSLNSGDAEGVASLALRVPALQAHAAAGSDVAAQSLRCPPTYWRRAFGAHPRCSDSPPRFVPERPLRGPCSYWPAAAPLVRNSPRGWAPKTLPDPEARVGRAKARQHRRQVRRHGREGRDRQLGSRNRFRIALVFREWPRPTTAPRHGSPSLNRIVVRDLGAYPRGEFRTSGAAVGQIDTWAALAAFPFRTRRTCLSSEGGHQGLPRETPKCRERWQSRAREAEGEPCARCERIPSLKAERQGPGNPRRTKKSSSRITWRRARLPRIAA
jgi:hypothetical protein